MNESTVCNYTVENYIFAEVIMMVYFGTAMAIFGFWANVLLIALFLGLKKYRSTHFAYLGALAILDLLITVSFVLLFVTRVIYDYFALRWLYIAFHSIVIPLFTTTKVLRTASVYTIIFATIERYVAVRKAGSQQKNFLKTYRLAFILFIITFSVGSRISTLFEFRIHVNETCIESFKYLTLAPASWTMNNLFRTVYHLYFNSFVHTILPFVLLLCLNVAIMKKLRSSIGMRTAMIQLAFGKKYADQRSETFRAATHTMVAIVTQYLVCNVLSFFLSLMEHFDIDTLHKNQEFYVFTANTVTLLHLINASIRIFIYILINPQIRHDCSAMTAVLTCFFKRRQALKLQKQNMSLSTVMDREITEKQVLTAAAAMSFEEVVGVYEGEESAV